MQPITLPHFLLLNQLYNSRLHQINIYFTTAKESALKHREKENTRSEIYLSMSLLSEESELYFI